MEVLIRKRGAIKAKVTSFSNLLRDVKHIRTVSEDHELKEAKKIELKLRTTRIENIFQEFENIQCEIEGISENFEEQLLERESFESNFYSKLALAKQLIKDKEDDVTENASVVSGSVESNRQDSNSGANVKLPQIKLPTFKGEYGYWLEFRDTFKALIHENEKITEVEKFHYLRASLQESAAQVILSIELSARNYQTAWEILCERYNNVSLLLHTHVNSLFELPTIAKESSYELRNLIDRLAKNLRALKILEQPIEHWDLLIIHMVTQKLDSKTLREWQEKKKTEASPSLEELKTFLRHKADVLETIEFNRTERKSKGQAQKARAFLATSNNHCPLCKGEHKLYSCEGFLKLSPQARYSESRKLNLCINCLNAGHIAKDCKSGQCRKCSCQHNTLLHINRDTKQGKDENPTLESREKAFTTHDNQVNKKNKHILLSTALVQLIDANGQPQTCRALLDSGA